MFTIPSPALCSATFWSLAPWVRMIEDWRNRWAPLEGLGGAGEKHRRTRVSPTNLTSKLSGFGCRCKCWLVQVQVLVGASVGWVRVGMNLIN